MKFTLLIILSDMGIYTWIHLQLRMEKIILNNVYVKNRCLVKNACKVLDDSCCIAKNSYWSISKCLMLKEIVSIEIKRYYTHRSYIHFKIYILVNNSGFFRLKGDNSHLHKSSMSNLLFFFFLLYFYLIFWDDQTFLLFLMFL